VFLLKAVFGASNGDMLSEFGMNSGCNIQQVVLPLPYNRNQKIQPAFGPGRKLSDM